MLEIFTDGSCSKNPGPGGWAAILKYGIHEKSILGHEVQTTNNRMELRAAIEGLKAVNRPEKIKVVTDSEYLKNGITKWINNWSAKNWKTASGRPVKNKDLWLALLIACEKHEQIKWEWVRGHAGHLYNNLTDQLARAAMEKGFKNFD